MGAQGGAGLVQAGADRALASAKAQGDFGLRQISEVKEHDGVALAGRKRGDRGGQLGRALGGQDASERLVAFVRRLFGRLAAGQDERRRGPPDAQAEHAADAREPCAEPVGVAQAVELQPRDQRRVLGDVRARVRVVQNALACTQQTSVVAREQLRERRHVAVAGARNKGAVLAWHRLPKTVAQRRQDVTQTHDR